ncbi:hypothetical protein AAFF_G00084660 [Aldrovandia affinis]|uniref:THUMP domain-containing protein 1 n=1 Tax=Aldrovandia affinis TaxID=143900 RepID=A0AAD7RX76_9TELE|nr:hypothetical protein AAFF_G00084660 [Aldrovandia affinis]
MDGFVTARANRDTGSCSKRRGGNSDHNHVHICPNYIPLIKRQPVTSKAVAKSTKEVADDLKVCFGDSVWNEFCKEYGDDVDGLTILVTDYMNWSASLRDDVNNATIKRWEDLRYCTCETLSAVGIVNTYQIDFGILITCNMNERKCTSEAFSLLNEYADQLYGPEKFSDIEESDSDIDNGADDDDDAEAALKKEVKQIRSSTQKRERRFQALDSGANNVVFIRTQHLDPDKLVHHILQDLHTTKKKKSRVILRMLPVSGTCKAFIEDMEKYLESFLEPWFKTPNQGTFQIVFKARNSSHNKREEVIKALAGLVGKMNPQNKVDLTNPECTIIIEVIKNVCCVSVVRDYMLFRKFNIQEVVKEQNLPQSTEGSAKGAVGQEVVDVKQDEGAGDRVLGQKEQEKTGEEAKEDGQDHCPGKQ